MSERELTDEALMDLAREHASDGGRWPSDWIGAMRAAITTDRAARSESKPKRAPVQGWAAGIPWELHLQAYEVYRKRWGAQPALIDLEGRGCRGGFSTGELDSWIPGWRERAMELDVLRADAARYRWLRAMLEGGGYAQAAALQALNSPRIDVAIDAGIQVQRESRP